MSRSEFRWNKKRKHYAYLYKDIGHKRMNILISSKPYVMRKGRIVFANIPLYKHPSAKKNGQFYLVPRSYLDDVLSFDVKIYTSWVFHKNDKRKVKRIKRKKLDRNTISVNHQLHK